MTALAREETDRLLHRLQPPTDHGSAVAPHAPPAQTNPAHLGYGCTGWENHLSIESNGPQRISVSHPGSHFGRFRRPAGYGVMGGRPRRSPHPQEVPQAGSAAQRRPAGARGAGRWPRVVAGRAGAFRGFGERRNAGSSSIARQRGPVDCPAGQTPCNSAPSYPNGAFYFVQITLAKDKPRRLSGRGRWLSGRTWASRCSTIIMG